MRRVPAVLLLLVAGLVVLAGLAVFLWGGFVAAVVSSDGTPGDVPGLVLVFVGALVMAGGGKLWGFAIRATGFDL